MRPPDDRLPRLVRSLDANAREIDLTFAGAGRQLGLGLDLFEALKQRLVTLSAELGGGDIVKANAALSGLAGELRMIGGGLRRETGCLQTLAIHSAAASQVLERLLEHMRLITILARSARIEAVSVHETGRDFGDFTSEIVDLTTQAQLTIQHCARDHDQLSASLGSALSTQHDFEQRYATSLTALAGTLDSAFAEVEKRQRRGVALTGEAAIHAGKIATAAGAAIISLQSGDSIRQRLEHAIATLRLLDAVEAGDGDGADLDPDERSAAGAILRRLQVAQLEASAKALGADAQAIEGALALLAGDTAALLDLVRSLYGGKAGDSFLTVLETNLAQASELLGKCDHARVGVDRVTATLSVVLATCQQTVAGLADTVSSIVLIGMNAGLRAARIGTGGRSLVVIAQELKLAADQVARDAGRLTPLFAQMQSAASDLTQHGGLDAAHFAALDRSMSEALAAMRDSGCRLSAALGQLTREGSSFHDVLGQASLSFSNAGAMSDVIAAGAADLARSVATEATPPLALPDRVGKLLQQHVWPLYTMATEREIHVQIVGGADTPSLAESGKVEHSDQLDEFMF